MVQNITSRIDVNSARGYFPKHIKHVHIDIAPFQEGCLGTSFMDIITDIHTHRHIYIYIYSYIYTSKITPKWAKTQLIIFISKVNRGTQNMFYVLLVLIYLVIALTRNCDKITNYVGRFSGFVAICDSRNL